MRRILFVHAGRPSGKYDAFRLQLADFVHGRIVRHELAVHAEVADTARDELVVLASEIQNDDQFARLVQNEWSPLVQLMNII